jgi:hypothetical protein
VSWISCIRAVEHKRSLHGTQNLLAPYCVQLIVRLNARACVNVLLILQREENLHALRRRPFSPPLLDVVASVQCFLTLVTCCPSRPVSMRRARR